MLSLELSRPLHLDRTAALIAGVLSPALAWAVAPLDVAPLSLEPAPPAQPSPSAAAAASLSTEPTAPPVLPASNAPRPWTVDIQPVLWNVAPSGDVKLPVTSGSGPGSFTTPGDSVSLACLALDGPRARPAGAFSINADNWRFTFIGADDSNSRSAITAPDSFRLGAVPVATGDKIDVDFHFGSYELTMGYMIWERDFKARSEHPENAIPLVMRLYALGGGRLYDVSFNVSRISPGPQASAGSDEFFGEPIAGVRAEADFTKTFGLDVQIDGGTQPFGNHNSYSLDIIAGFHYRPIDNLALTIGYRQLAFNLSDGDDLGQFRYKGRLAGLYFGIDVRF